MQQTHKAKIFRLDTEKAKLNFFKFKSEHPDLEIIDTIFSQIGDLIKLKNPSKKFSDQELELAQQELLNGNSIHDFGAWIYYPWSRRLVHLLDEKDFALVRTNRNQYKITHEQQSTLSSKKIGLVGLSVGHSVAMTLALERSFSELRIADFDVLDLSNLNRIRTAVHHIDINKSVIVAREIAELDPYLKVTCYQDGINSHNIEDFISGDGKLDLLIDECDSIDIKIILREKAKAASIPVLMETSDRGMLDIERFDLDPDLPILHGLVEGLESSQLVGLSNEEKIPYVLPIIGLDKSSIGLRMSMFEIDKSISTWPQLGSDVTLGGATTSHISRKILLGEPVPNGRFYIDMDELIQSDIESKASEKIINKEPKIAELEVLFQNKASTITSHGEAIDRKHLEQFIYYASKAPSGGNTQPWLWHIHGNSILLFMDTRKGFAFLDYKYRGSILALGAASENLRIAAQNAGYQCENELFEFDESEDFPLVASFSFKQESSISAAPLFDFLEKRNTNRLNEGRVALSKEFVHHITKDYDALGNNSTLHLIHNDSEISVIKEVLSVSDKLVMMNTKGHKDLYGELKWNKDFSEKEGINVNSLGLTALEAAGMQIAKDDDVIASLQRIGGGDRFSEMNHKAIDSSSSIGMVTIKDYDKEAFYNAGSDIQHLWLESTSQSVSVYPFTGIIYLINRIHHGGRDDLSQMEVDLLLNCESKLRRVFKLEEKDVMAFLFRYSMNTQTPPRSNRKPLEDILI